MKHPADQCAAWAAVLPPGTVWLPSRRGRASRPGPPAGSSLAAMAPPWALRRDRDAGDPAAPRVYIAIPSRHAPMLIASQDPPVLRYVADCVLSVPPGTGPVLSMIMTAALRLLRLRAAWMMAAAVRAGAVVLVGRLR